MKDAAPYEYVERYYVKAFDKCDRFPVESAFWMDHMKRISGERVLNAGCGPVLYDDVGFFSEPPAHYVGVDISESAGRFMAESRIERLVEAKRFAEARVPEIDFINAPFLDIVDRFPDYFDQILGIGFFGIFPAAEFDAIAEGARRMLRPGGTLVTVTWNGPNRPPEAQREELEFGFDTAENLSADQFVERMNAAGLDTVLNRSLKTDPATYGWHDIQVCEFARRS